MEKSWFPIAKQTISISQNEVILSKNKWLTLARESALTNQKGKHVYKYVSIRRKSKAISSRGVWKWKKKMVYSSQKIRFH